MSVEHILVESSNIGTIAVQMSLGEGDWDLAQPDEYMRAFGLGEKTALDFPGESNGILKHWSDLWGPSASRSPTGRASPAPRSSWSSAVNTIANDGTLRGAAARAGLHRAATASDRRRRPSATREVISPRSPTQMQHMMREVVCRAARASWRSVRRACRRRQDRHRPQGPGDGYLNAAGERAYYASFVGFFPAEDPQVTVLVSIDEPPAGDINRFGGTAAAPVFAGLAPVIAHEMGLVPPAGSTRLRRSDRSWTRRATSPDDRRLGAVPDQLRRP